MQYMQYKKFIIFITAFAEGKVGVENKEQFDDRSCTRHGRHRVNGQQLEGAGENIFRRDLEKRFVGVLHRMISEV